MRHRASAHIPVFSSVRRHRYDPAAVLAQSSKRCTDIHPHLSPPNMVGKRTFWQAKDGDFTEGAMCKFANSVPKCRKTGNPTADQDAALVRKNVVNAVDMLMRAPAEAGHTVTWLTDRLERQSKPSDSNGDTWAEVSTLGKIDEIWLAWWVCSSSKITKAALERAKGNDPQSVVHLVCYALNALPSLALPPECVDKVFFSCALRRR